MVNPAQQRQMPTVQGPTTYNHSGSIFRMPRETKTTTTLGRITPILLMAIS